MLVCAQRANAESARKRLRLAGGLGLMVQSGMCDAFELRLDHWQGMAESGDPLTVLQVLNEMAG